MINDIEWRYGHYHMNRHVKSNKMSKQDMSKVSYWWSEAKNENLWWSTCVGLIK